MSMLKSRYNISQWWSNGILFVLLGREHVHRPTTGAANFSDLTSHAYFQKVEKHFNQCFGKLCTKAEVSLGKFWDSSTKDNTRNYLGHGINNIIATNQCFPHILGKQEHY